MARSSGSGLSKSLILKGLQCPKALWLTKNPPDFALPPDPQREARFARGIEIGTLARQLYPGGIEVPYEGMSFPAQLARTRELLARGVDVIYEASFSFSAIFVKVDILVRDADAWQIHEVKMATSVKPVNLDDVAVQHYVLNGCGLKISKDYLLHLDAAYAEQERTELQRMFVTEDISLRVASRLQSVQEIVSACRQTLRERQEPAIKVGDHCHLPYDCEFFPYCSSSI